MDKAQKAEALASLKGVFADAGVVLIVHYAGMTVAEMTDLRSKFRGPDATMRVVKNRIAKLALKDLPGEVGSDLFSGPVAIIYSPDAVGTSKVAIEYAKKNEDFVLLGGILGATLLDAEGVKSLSTMPSIEESRAKLVGSLNAPAGMFVRTLNAPGTGFVTSLNGVGRNLASVLTQYKAKLEEAA